MTLARRAQAHAHQFHYETGATRLYWFGTQYILARRSHVDPLAKLLILSLLPERWRAPWPLYCTETCVRMRTQM
jgi:hypothetical protein